MPSTSPLCVSDPCILQAEVPTYFDVIKRPMDLSTMERKLETGVYKNTQMLRDDFELMVRNAVVFYKAVSRSTKC